MLKFVGRPAVAAATLAASVLAATDPAVARHWHHRRTAPVAAPAPPPPTHSFYPESVEGGVPGNLSFNNQLRKLSDPLNANGGR